MQRTPLLILLFAGVMMLAAAVSSWLVIRGAQQALESEFELSRSSTARA